MIAGLQSYAREHQLAVPSELGEATVGLAADALAGLSSAEISARLGAAPAAWIVVFDGPARTTRGPLTDGLERRRVLAAVLDAGVAVLSAPGVAAAQLAYLHQHRFISHAAGADETLLWGDVPVVYDAFAERPLVLRKPALLAHLRLPDPAFVEAALGAGSAVALEPYPLLPRDGEPFEAAVRALHFGGGSLLRAARQATDAAYVARFEKALAFVYRQPLLDLDGTVLLSNRMQQPVPKDLHDVVGRQLPAEAYWYLSKGLLGPELPAGLLWGWFADAYRMPTHPPGPHAAFRAVEAAVSPARQQAFALLTQILHRYFQVKETVNRTEGSANFVRTTPAAPAPPAAPDSPDSVVDAAVAHVAKFVAAPAGMKPADVPDYLVQTAVAKLPDRSEPVPPTVVKVARLALREFAESAIVHFFATGAVPRDADTAAIIQLIPW